MDKDEAIRRVVEALTGNGVNFSRESPRDAARMGLEMGFDVGYDAGYDIGVKAERKRIYDELVAVHRIHLNDRMPEDCGLCRIIEALEAE